MSAMPRTTFHSIPMPDLCALAFEAYQQGAMATHDALVRERLRRQFSAQRVRYTVERRRPGRPFATPSSKGAGFLQTAMAAALPQVAFQVKMEARVVELRAITGMSQQDAISWLQVLQGLQATSAIESQDSAWFTFRQLILQGGSPLDAAAMFVAKMTLNNAGLRI